MIVTEPLDPGICDFEETSSCKYFYNSTTASEYQWIRRVGMLQSGFFGPNNDAYGKINGKLRKKNSNTVPFLKFTPE